MDRRSSPPLPMLAADSWDLLVVGGGITGTGIMCEAARLGLRVLLIEQRDYASGTSSRSSKLVHGGLHYLMRLQLGLTRTAVREREALLRDGGGLVEPLEFLVPMVSDDRLHRMLVPVGLGVYDALAGRVRRHERLRPDAILARVPCLTPRLTCAYAFMDAVSDDARLVLQVLRQGRQFGGHAVNGVAATDLLRDRRGRVVGVCARQGATGCTAELHARVVVNATGPWADRLRGQLGAFPRLRPVRGSHLIFPRDRLPLDRAIATRHPDSRLPLFCIPWAGVTLVGTTHVDHPGPLDDAPSISPEETAYLLRGAQDLFPARDLCPGDIRATFAGLRPIVDTRTGDPARASRDHAIWDEDGMLTVTGGKLTTFRATARQTLHHICRGHPEVRRRRVDRRPYAAPPVPDDLPFDWAATRRLLARYGPYGLAAISAMPPAEREPVPGSSVLWGELRWAARAEEVRHLDDLLLRRSSIGLTAPEGGLPWLDRIRCLIQSELGWDDGRWQAEVDAYRDTWRQTHGVPGI